MTQPLTPDQAKIRANRALSALGPIDTWTIAQFDQAVLYIGCGRRPFGMNDIRLLGLPDDACRKAGQYFHGLAQLAHPTVLEYVGEVVSINPKAHGKKVNEYLLTETGNRYLRQRINARIEQRRAA